MISSRFAHPKSELRHEARRRLDDSDLVIPNNRARFEVRGGAADPSCVPDADESSRVASSTTAAAVASPRKRWVICLPANCPAKIIFTATMRSRLTCRAL